MSVAFDVFRFVPTPDKLSLPEKLNKPAVRYANVAGELDGNSKTMALASKLPSDKAKDALLSLN